MTDATGPRGVAPRLTWKGGAMSRDHSDRRPSTPAGVTVANPRRTRLALDRVVRGSEGERAGR